MLKRTEGIVLKTSIFGEADLIVTYLTPDNGLIKAFARSPRKIKSRFGSSLEPLTYSTISLLGKEESSLPRLTQSDIIKPFYSLREDMDCLLNISELLEMNLKFLPERYPNPEIFRLLLKMLLKIENNRGNELYYLYYKMRFLEIAGYSPRLDACGRCGKAPAQRNFYICHGSIMCHKCIGGGEDSIRISDSALKFYRSLVKWKPVVIDRIVPPARLMSEISGVINSHVKYVIGLPKSSSSAAFKGFAGR